MGRCWTMHPWDNCGDRRSQPQQLLIHNTTHHKWQKDNTQQVTHQTNISDSRCIHAIPSHKTYTQTKWPTWGILECIRNNLMAYATPKQNNNTSSQKTNHEQQANNVQQGRGQDPRWKTMNILWEDTGYTHQGNKVVKTWYRRIIRKPDRLKYE